MHFSIPDTQECTEGNGSSYMGYNLHVNGEFHCTIRYRQLHFLNDQLRKYHGPTIVPVFPPKKYWPLTPNQVEERRSQLEKFIQTVGQTPSLMHSDVFNKFLLTAQQESSLIKVQDVVVDVFLMNGSKVSVSVSSDESTDYVLEKVCNQINLPLPYMNYFSLFLVRREDDGDLTILRKLHDFESPYISFRSILGAHKILLRKSYWDPEYDLELMYDRVALNLLYVQTVADLERGWISCPEQIHSQLTTLQARGAKKEYLELARTLRYYGYTQFRECISNYPVPDSKVIVSAGQKELNLRMKLINGETKEYSFKVTRMRCWRITTRNDYIEGDNEIYIRKSSQLELSFEYLLSRDNLQWITISSEQAILMSVCLQSIVDELLIKKSGAKVKQPGECRNGNFNYMKRDGSSLLIPISQSSSADTLSTSTNGSVASPVKCETSISMKKLSEKLSTLSTKMTKGEQLIENENDAFEGIGDDDL